MIETPPLRTRAQELAGALLAAETPAERIKLWRELSELIGYRIEVDPDGTERMFRPDGTLAMIAQPPKDSDA